MRVSALRQVIQEIWDGFFCIMYRNEWRKYACAAGLSAKVEEQCATVLAMPSGKAHAEQVKEKMQKIKNDQSLLIQWAEEKVQLAVTGHQLLEKYAHALDGDIANLTQYLTDTGQLVDEYMPDEYGVNHEPHLYDNVTSRRAGSSRPGYTSSIDGAVEMQEQSELCRLCFKSFNFHWIY